MGSTATNVGAMITTYMTGAATNSSVNISQKNNADKAAASFDNILNQISDVVIQNRSRDTAKEVYISQDNTKQNVQVKETTQTKADTTDKALNTDYKKTVVKDDNKQVQNTETTKDGKGNIQKEDKAEPGDDLKEALEKAGEELAEEITDVLDISEEELINVMELLGLTFVDLLSTENLQQVVTAAGGQEQALDLITDSDIYTSLQDLMEGAEGMKSELMNEFDLSEEDFGEVVKDPTFKETFESHVDSSNKVDEELIETAHRKVDLDPKPITDNKETKASQSEGFKDIQTTEEREIATVVSTQKSSTDSGKQNFQSGSESANLFNQIVNNITEAVDVQATGALSYTDRTQMENIVRQLTEKISIMATEDKTTMELSLHPASLGNVNIMLTSSKEGIVAKFTAQNQIVKEAVEAQMTQLQQKFDEAGIKVTSIEVTIASHAFEQNLQQQDRGNEPEENTKSGKKGLRRINLTEIGEAEEEEMSEAERIAAQMMAMNGNSVDFSA